MKILIFHVLEKVYKSVNEMGFKKYIFSIQSLYISD